ncbi:MAG TPA: ATP synthase F1 subunit delta, partial [Flavobacterium sp.]
MSVNRAANPYAKAILETSTSKGAAMDVNADMKVIADAINENPELSAFLQSPITKTDAKESVLLEIFPAVNDITRSLFNLLLANKRFEILGDIAAEYNRLFDEMNGIEVAKVTTAVPMDDEMES